MGRTSAQHPFACKGLSGDTAEAQVVEEREGEKKTHGEIVFLPSTARGLFFQMTGNSVDRSLWIEDFMFLILL